MTSVTQTFGPSPILKRLSGALADIRKADSVAYLTLFLAVVFGFTDVLANCLLLFFIFTTYIPAPVLGFGFTLSVLGFALAKERSQFLSAAYLLSMAAVLFYQVPWRNWVLGI